MANWRLMMASMLVLVAVMLGACSSPEATVPPVVPATTEAAPPTQSVVAEATATLAPTNVPATVTVAPTEIPVTVTLIPTVVPPTHSYEDLSWLAALGMTIPLIQEGCEYHSPNAHYPDDLLLVTTPLAQGQGYWATPGLDKCGRVAAAMFARPEQAYQQWYSQTQDLVRMTGWDPMVNDDYWGNSGQALAELTTCYARIWQPYCGSILVIVIGNWVFFVESVGHQDDLMARSAVYDWWMDYREYLEINQIVPPTE